MRKRRNRCNTFMSSASAGAPAALFTGFPNKCPTAGTQHTGAAGTVRCGVIRYFSSWPPVPAVIFPLPSLIGVSSLAFKSYFFEDQAFFCAPVQAEPVLEHTLAEGSWAASAIVVLALIIRCANESNGFAGILRKLHTIAWNQLTEITVRLFGWELI